MIYYSTFRCNCIDQAGCTALMIVAQKGRHECLSVLLAHGADVNMAGEVSTVGIRVEKLSPAVRCTHCFFVDKDGFTALMIAAQEGHQECISILLAHGADVKMADRVSAVGIITASPIVKLLAAVRCVLNVSSLIRVGGLL